MRSALYRPCSRSSRVRAARSVRKFASTDRALYTVHGGPATAVRWSLARGVDAPRARFAGGAALPACNLRRPGRSADDHHPQDSAQERRGRRRRLDAVPGLGPGRGCTRAGGPRNGRRHRSLADLCTLRTAQGDTLGIRRGESILDMVKAGKALRVSVPTSTDEVLEGKALAGLQKVLAAPPRLSTARSSRWSRRASGRASPGRRRSSCSASTTGSTPRRPARPSRRPRCSSTSTTTRSRPRGRHPPSHPGSEEVRLRGRATGHHRQDGARRVRGRRADLRVRLRDRERLLGAGPSVPGREGLAVHDRQDLRRVPAHRARGSLARTRWTIRRTSISRRESTASSDSRRTPAT